MCMCQWVETMGIYGKTEMASPMAMMMSIFTTAAIDAKEQHDVAGQE